MKDAGVAVHGVVEVEHRRGLVELHVPDDVGVDEDLDAVVHRLHRDGPLPGVLGRVGQVGHGVGEGGPLEGGEGRVAVIAELVLQVGRIQVGVVDDVLLDEIERLLVPQRRFEQAVPARRLVPVQVLVPVVVDHELRIRGGLVGDPVVVDVPADHHVLQVRDLGGVVVIVVAVVIPVVIVVVVVAVVIVAVVVRARVVVRHRRVVVAALGEVVLVAARCEHQAQDRDRQSESPGSH